MADKEAASAKKTDDKIQTQKKEADTTNAAMPEQAPEEEEGEKSILDRVVEKLGCDANKKTIAGDSGLMTRVMNEFNGEERDEALDFLFDAVKSADILMEMIYVRFGVVIIDDRKETWQRLNSKTKQVLKDTKATPQKWSASGLICVYRAYIHLPKGDLKKINCVLRNSKEASKLGGRAYGTTGGTYGVYEINFGSGQESYSDMLGYGPSNIDDFADRRMGTNTLTMTAAHELGHVVDGAAGWKYSKKGSSMWKVSKWEETPNNATKIVDKMIECLKGAPYGKTLTDDERKIARKVGITIISKEMKSWDAAKTSIKSALPGAIKSSGKKMDNAKQTDLYARLTDNKNSLNLLYHLFTGQSGQQPWNRHKEVMKGKSKPFHEGKPGEAWYTYDNNRWNDKISTYQYRNPKEEFAELYASYHAAPAVGKKKGENTPADLLAWFIGQGLGDKEAELGNAGNQGNQGKK